MSEKQNFEDIAYDILDAVVNPDAKVMSKLLLVTSKEDIKRNLIISACSLDNINPEAMDELVKYYKNISSDDEFTFVLNHSIRCGYSVSAIKILLKYCADKKNQKFFEASLWTAALGWKASPELINAIIEYGAKVNIKNNFDYTLLMMAVDKNISPQGIELLIKNGAEVNAKDYKDRTALSIAQKHNNQEIIAVLLKYGAVS